MKIEKKTIFTLQQGYFRINIEEMRINRAIKYFLPAALVMVIILFSCQQDEGVGGFHTITGKVVTYEINRNTLDTTYRYGTPDARVYLTYGDNEIFDDDTRTQYDGQYKFEYLFPGFYTVYVYSECLVCPGNAEPVFREVEIEEKKGETVLDSIIIFDYK